MVISQNKVEDTCPTRNDTANHAPSVALVETNKSYKCYIKKSKFTSDFKDKGRTVKNQSHNYSRICRLSSIDC